MQVLKEAIMGKPVLCLDFDGVIHSYTSGWTDLGYIADPPVPGAITFMLQALRLFDVVIFSSRSKEPRGIAAMQNWLKLHGGNAWHESAIGPGLSSVRFVTDKPAALVTLDDRAITFTGVWPPLDTLINFKPWNKK
jgi:hypothetical protein